MPMTANTQSLKNADTEILSFVSSIGKANIVFFIFCVSLLFYFFEKMAQIWQYLFEKHSLSTE